jgi:hypothetical protein
VVAVHQHRQQRELHELDEAVTPGDVARVEAVVVVIVTAP